jgi:hypothetical protein
MGPAHRHPRASTTGHLVGTALGCGGFIDQTGHAMAGIAPEPGMDGLSSQSVAQGYVGDRRPVEDFAHCLVAHCSTSPRSTNIRGLLRVCGRELSTAKEVAGRAWRTLVRREVSCRYRSQCRPGTGAASGKCQTGTGATVSSMNRNFTGISHVLSPRCGDKRRCHRLSPHSRNALTCVAVVGLPGFEPGTS